MSDILQRIIAVQAEKQRRPAACWRAVPRSRRCLRADAEARAAAVGLLRPACARPSPGSQRRHRRGEEPARAKGCCATLRAGRDRRSYEAMARARPACRADRPGLLPGRVTTCKQARRPANCRCCARTSWSTSVPRRSARSRAMGADCILLIAACLDDARRWPTWKPARSIWTGRCWWRCTTPPNSTGVAAETPWA